MVYCSKKVIVARIDCCVQEWEVLRYWLKNAIVYVDGADKLRRKDLNKLLCKPG